MYVNVYAYLSSVKWYIKTAFLISVLEVKGDSVIFCSGVYAGKQVGGSEEGVCLRREGATAANFRAVLLATTSALSLPLPLSLRRPRHPSPAPEKLVPFTWSLYNEGSSKDRVLRSPLPQRRRLRIQHGWGRGSSYQHYFSSFFVLGGGRGGGLWIASA